MNPSVPVRGTGNAGGRFGLRRWLLRWFAPMLLAATVIAVVASVVVVIDRFDEVERALALDQFARVQQVFEREADALATEASDYAGWDDTLAFMREGDPEYLRINYNPALAESLSLSWLILQDREGRVRAAIDLQAEGEGAPVPLDETELGAILAALPHAERDTDDLQLSGAFWAADTPMQIGIAAISNSERTVPSEGWLWFGRRLLGGHLERYRKQAGLDFELLPAEPSPPWVAASPEAEGWRVEGGHPKLPGIARVELPPRLLSERRATLALLTITTPTVAILAIGLALWMLHRQIVRRLEHFVRLADAGQANVDGAICWPDADRDEIDILGRALNQWFEQTRQHARALDRAARTDTLSGLGNRRHLIEAIEQRGSIDEGAAALVLVDVDGFKQVNDGMGHAAGDAVLVAFGARVGKLAGADDVAVRLGGDEFAVLLARSGAEALAWVESLRHALLTPVPFEGRLIPLGVSIGLAWAEPGIDASEWLRRADLAMYQAKRERRSGIEQYHAGLREQALQRSRETQALRRGLLEQTIEVAYQPIVDGASGAVVGLEALARWRYQGAVVPAEHFIQLAEENALMVPLGRQVLDAACATLVALRIRHRSLCCSVNLSVQQFTHGDVLADVERALEEHALPGSALRLEITESLFAERSETVVASMRQLRDRGLRIVLDDFGVGYSSLDRLQSMPVDGIKIDRRFVEGLRDGEQRLVRRMIQLAADFNLDCVAEGIESVEQRDLLLELGCQRMQGYWFARPMPRDELEAWLQRHAAQPAP